MKILFLGACLSVIISIPNTYAQQSFWDEIKQQPATLNIQEGTHEFHLTNLNLQILKSSQTVAGLKLSQDKEFDYTADELLNKRDKNRFFHLGDINLSIRKATESTWTAYSSALARKDVLPLKTKGSVLAAADLSSTLPNLPLQIIRSWENQQGDLILRFEIKNNTSDSYEIGDLGVPMIFNNNMENKNLDMAHQDNVFFDPYIGRDAGYLQVNRLHGLGPSLLVLPLENSGFEAYQPLNSDPTPRGITFEGFHEWMIHSKAKTETEWKAVEPWNTATSTLLKPGESKTFGFKFVLAPSIKEIESELIQNKRPVAIGAPGYVVPLDVPAQLFIQYHKSIASIDIYPSNALQLKKLPTTKHGWKSYEVIGKHWGRARLTINYRDGIQQTIHYKVIKSEKEVVKDLGNFLTTKQWYENDNDPFGRSPSIITYDNETHQPVTQERRAWFAGLSDEAGAASWLAAIMKQLLVPDPTEINKLKQFVDKTLFAKIQLTTGEKKYGVVKSLFYYEPDSMPVGTYDANINYKTWSAWPKKEADDIGRSYNYPHVAAAHWVFYRLARNYSNLVTEEKWETYLNRAFETSMAMINKAPYYAQFGQMEGSIFLIVLNDLRREGFTDQANLLESAMRKRAEHWKTLNYPFGSEMPWDSTGQEEVYLWSKFFGFDDKAAVTLNAILAYMPTLPHWGYNGSARRYWDFVYGGKLARIERQLHHYGSALNAIPVLTDFRNNPRDFYLLRVGHAGTLGALANVTQEGFGPSAFHSYPSTLANDGISGDYGSGFYGYAVNSGTYIIQHPEFGWLAFSGLLKDNKETITVDIKTASRARIFLAEEKLWITSDVGEIDQLTYYKKAKTVILTLNNTTLQANHFLLNINPESGYTVTDYQQDSVGRYRIPAHTQTVTLKKKSI
ncbi:DUF5695 domain-containing protein [Sphingobacterium sp. SRCM116780]|uniref:DUF5695 domain-containing protein n=1 Tax=Sphingobacterium sp. SRCM116780 TaxID=2907623 RepID=UPI001F2C0A1B|nr:DUF5695 domain-containing protein [Sphingobacterium sp. SRCM116780]UIR54646.1 DUF5695 domain-containing protein [Sphingobacterium sp. SRCM116780]